jgi:carboxymethylenebutenolidase
MHDLTRPEGSESRDFNLSRRGVAAAVLAGYAVGAGPVRADPIQTDTQGLMAERIEITAPDGFKLPAYVAAPENAGAHTPSILVVSEIFGLHEYIRDVARRLAKQGYIAIAPDYFARAGDASKIAEMQSVMKIVATATNAQVMGDSSAALDWVQGHFPGVKRFGVTGFCWGGGVTWMAVATDPRFKAGVAWYGRLVGPPNGTEKRDYPVDIAGKLHGPVLGLYAGKDKGITQENVEAMRAKLKAVHSKSEIVVYPDANHGFHADYRANTYHQPDAEDGWKRLLAWFDKYVKHG